MLGFMQVWLKGQGNKPQTRYQCYGAFSKWKMTITNCQI